MTDQFRDDLQQALGSTYSIEREITGGGMSRVFVAIEHALGRTVVIKVLRPELAAGVNRDRFRREIMLAAQLQHPHIVPLLSAGESGDLLWYTMPFVEGESLREAIARSGKLAARDVTRVLHDVLDALSYAHRRGVVHRDIKPGNILRHGSHSLVTDFGVAKALSAALPHSGTTSVGIAIGTPAYMAPEQLAADPAADHRMDLYAVGLLAYELLAGEQPFSGLSPQATMTAQLTRMPAPLATVRPDTPEPLAALIMRMLEKQPEDRPESAAAALEELEAMATPQTGGVTSPGYATSQAGNLTPVGAPALTPSATTAETRPPRARRNALFLGGALVAAAVGIVFAARTRSEPRAAPAIAGTDAPRVDTVVLPAPPAPPATPRIAATPPVASSAPSASSNKPQVQKAPALTRADSLRIAEAVRKEIDNERRVDVRTLGTDRDVDSLQRALEVQISDSMQRVLGENPVNPRSAGAMAKAALALAKRNITNAIAGATRGRVGAHAEANAKVSFSRPRRVALLPVRDGTGGKPELAPFARVVEDSLRRALAQAGYTLATDAEVLRLVSTPDMMAQRQLADAAGIGAVVSGTTFVHSDEFVAQTIILDVWRGLPQAEKDEGDLDDPKGALGVVRNVVRALARVSWRSRNDAKRLLIFDLEAMPGREDASDVARLLSDSLRSAAAKRFGVEVVSDAAARATRGSSERRIAGERTGAGAVIAGMLYRRGDSLVVRMSLRDMSEEKTLNPFEARVAADSPFALIPLLLERLGADVGRVNWGPRGTTP